MNKESELENACAEGFCENSFWSDFSASQILQEVTIRGGMVATGVLAVYGAMKLADIYGIYHFF